MKTSSRQVILASQSLQRKIICETLKINLKIVPSNIDEKKIRFKNLSQQAFNVAAAKAAAIIKRHPHDIVVAADTFLGDGLNAFEKPSNKKEAITMLETMSNRVLLVYTGFAYLDQLNNLELIKTVKTKVVFRKLSHFEIQAYAANNPVTTWSAGFCPAYPSGMSFVKSISGSLTSFTHGLPLELMVLMLAKSHIYN